MYEPQNKSNQEAIFKSLQEQEQKGNEESNAKFN